MAPKILPVVKSKLVTDCFTFTEKLGSGQFGVVRICVDKFTKRIFACKSILKRSLGVSDNVKVFIFSIVQGILAGIKLN